MYVALNSAQARALDSYMINDKKIPGIVLMENAAIGVINKIEEISDDASVAVFCGTGNNGGDGFAIARGLIARGHDVTVVVVGDAFKIKGDAKINFDYISLLEDVIYADSEEILHDAMHACEHCDIIVDALFGTGLDRPVEGLHEDCINIINSLPGTVVSVDIPSGVNADTGRIMNVCVNAQHTVTFQTMKRGHFLYPGAAFAGDVSVTVLGDDEGAEVYNENIISAYTLFDEHLSVSSRKNNSHKGDYGKLLIVAGSEGMSGAAYMTAAAAVRTGAGLTSVASVGYVCDRLQSNMPEVMTKVLPDKNGVLSKSATEQLNIITSGISAIAVGPGLGKGEGVLCCVEHIVENYDVVKIFDADAINALAENPDVLYKKVGKIILTPHPKEFSRLSGLSVSEILKDPVNAVKQFAESYDVTVLLKGACSVIADSENGVSFMCADVPAMAKGGSGDVLTGIIAALAAQNDDEYFAALMGAYIHVSSGYYAQCEKGEYSVTARDIIEKIPKVFSEITAEADMEEDYYAPNEDEGVYFIESEEEAEDEDLYFDEYTECDEESEDDFLDEDSLFDDYDDEDSTERLKQLEFKEL